MTQNTKDNGVSPVIAVLLILAITVVAAGVVAVVATGMTGELQNGKQVGLIVKPAASGGDVLVTVVSGKDVPELTKLEVIDGGSTDAVFREVRLSDGGNVTSFTAGAGYVARNVADPDVVLQSYTTPVVVKGTFKDGTETVLLNLKLTFTEVSPVAPLKDYIKDLYMKSLKDNGTAVNISLTDLFYKGIPQSLKISDLPSSHEHGITIEVPKELLEPGTVAKIVIRQYGPDGTEISGRTQSTYGNPGTISQPTYTLDNGVSYIKVTIDVYDEKQYQEYYKIRPNTDWWK
ncbi:MAG: type IV pilin, partial [Methanocorpusculum sp.]|nr:type IV pilin [Methanocorpusculum sp.]